jgi:hypothetical protein
MARERGLLSLTRRTVAEAKDRNTALAATVLILGSLGHSVSKLHVGSVSFANSLTPITILVDVLISRTTAISKFARGRQERLTASTRVLVVARVTRLAMVGAAAKVP